MTETARNAIAMVALGVIVLGSSGLAALWAFTVPVFQAPDEPLHLDYALAIQQHGGLFHPQALEPARNNNGYENIFTHDYVHPYTRYLLERTSAGTIAFNPAAKVAPDYGSPEFMRALDRNAPQIETDAAAVPFLFRLYPFGYYALLAGWINVVRCVDNRLSVLFFAARLFSVAMLATTLMLLYATLRLLRRRRSLSLAVTAAIGFFPLTTFIASYVQPDNLSWLLISLCFYLALRLRNGATVCDDQSLKSVGSRIRQTRAFANCAVLGLVLAALVVTKLHYHLVTAIPILTMLWGARARKPFGVRKPIGAALLISPSIIAGAFYFWTIRGSIVLLDSATQGATSWRETLLWSQRAFRDFYVGLSHRSFWGVFGWLDTPLVFHDSAVTRVFRIALTLCTLVLLTLTIVRVAQVSKGLVRLLGRRRYRVAWEVAFGNPLINSYFLFTVMMFFLYVRLRNAFGGQGRNWLPLLLPIVLTAVVYAPQVFRKRRARILCSAAVLTGLLAFDALGSVFAHRSIRQRYYTPFHGQPLTAQAVQLQSTIERPLEYHFEGREHVRGVRIRFTHTNAAMDRSVLRVSWKKQTVAEFNIVPGYEARTLTIWVNDVIDSIRLEPDAKTSCFTVHEMALLKDTDANVLARK